MSPMIVSEIIVPGPQHLASLEERGPVLRYESVRVVDVARYLEATLREVADEDYGLEDENGGLLYVLMFSDNGDKFEKNVI